MTLKSTNNISLILGILGLLGTVASHTLAGPHEHGEDVVVGRTSSGQLATEVPVPGPHELPPISGLLNGWAADEPGLMNLAVDEPDEGFFVLGSGAIISLELVSIDPALKIWSPGFNAALTAPGQSFILGGSEFDTHGTFHIDATDPNFDPNQNLYVATLRLVDTGTTGYSPSAPFSLSFTPVPEPATSLMLLMSSIGLIARRRSARP